MPDPHTGFIVAAFAVTIVVIGAIMLAIIFDHRRLRRDLDRLAHEMPAGSSDEAERP